MALHTYTTSVINSGNAIEFGADEDISVGVDALIGSTGGSGIVCTGSTHSVTLAGAVASDSSGIELGSDKALDSGQNLSILAGATIDSGSSSVVIKGSASTLDNGGVLTGYYGVVINGDAATGHSTLTNDGTIRTDGSYTFAQAISREGSEDFQLINNGLIKALTWSYSGASSTGDQTIINNGKMDGEVQLGDGNDVYDGHKGIVLHGEIWGGGGDDQLIGGRRGESLEGVAGSDILTGHKGADHFIFRSAGDSTVDPSGRDLITDFHHAQHDKIDLAVIDAKKNGSADDAFSFVGTDAFSGDEGDLRSFVKHGHTIVQGDIDGDRDADFSIALTGRITLHGGDFIL